MMRRHQRMQLPIIALILLVGAANTAVAGGHPEREGTRECAAIVSTGGVASVKALADQLACSVEFFDVEGCPAFLLSDGQASVAADALGLVRSGDREPERRPHLDVSTMAGQRDRHGGVSTWESRTAVPAAARSIRLFGRL